MNEKRIHIIVKGLVQGVFFRAYTQQIATELGLTGTVRNLTDGSVEIVAQGDGNSVKQLTEWCWNGSPASKVSEVNITEVTTVQPSTGFSIIR